MQLLRIITLKKLITTDMLSPGPKLLHMKLKGTKNRKPYPQRISIQAFFSMGLQEIFQTIVHLSFQYFCE